MPLPLPRVTTVPAKAMPISISSADRPGVLMAAPVLAVNQMRGSGWGKANHHTTVGRSEDQEHRKTTQVGRENSLPLSSSSKGEHGCMWRWPFFLLALRLALGPVPVICATFLTGTLSPARISTGASPDPSPSGHEKGLRQFEGHGFVCGGYL